MAADPLDPASVNCIACNTAANDSWSPAVVIAFIVLLAHLASLYFTHIRDRRRDQSAKVDEAWFKAIVLDDCLPALQKYVATQRAQFQELARGENQTHQRHVRFITQFDAETESLQRKLTSTECMSVKAMQSSALEIEHLGDLVATNASKVLDAANSADVREAAFLSTVQEFDRRAANCLAIWKQLHHALQQGKDTEA